MEKSELLKQYKRQEDKILLGHILDNIQFSEEREKVENTDFLDMYQISLLETFFRKIKFSNYILYGGYKQAERKILIIHPEKYDLEKVNNYCDNLINIVRIDLKDEDKGKFYHRNYLGGIIKLGINREKIGDIIVSEEGADIITIKDFANILNEQLQSLARFRETKITILDIKQLKKCNVQIESIKIIVPSLRLDNIISDLARTSRSKAVQIINSERVFINGQNETKVSKQIKLDDIITIRGKGRFIIKEFVGNTRSGRIIVRIEKYI